MEIRISYYIAIACFLICAPVFLGNNRYNKWMVWLLLQNVIADSLVLRFSKYVNEIYNIHTVLEMLVMIWILYSFLNGKKKWIIQACIVLYAAAFANIFFIQGWKVFHIYTYIPIGLFIAFLSYLYLKQEIEYSDIPFWKNETGWFAIANLFYYTCHIPVMSSLFYLARHNTELNINLFQVNTVLFSIWLILITLGIQWKHLQKIYSMRS